MQNVSTALSSHLAQEVMTLATCWKLTRKDNVVLGFTDHDVDIVFSGVTYKARSGMTPTAVTTSLGLQVDNLDIEGLLSDDAITEADVLAGVYDYAAVEVFIINYKDVSAGKLSLTTGWLGEVTLKGQQFIAEVRSLSQKLQQTIGEIYTPTCRANLGDGRCAKNLAAFTFTGTIDTVQTNERFYDAARTEASGYFSYGKVTFTSGNNAGFSTEIREFTNGTFTLFIPTPKALQVGDSYAVIAGCDKRLDTCITRFNNALNFRGEPHVPGMDKMLETSATRSIE
ncbi:MAG: DUF2163 domain-containing protein [Rickettsiales bacterium]